MPSIGKLDKNMQGNFLCDEEEIRFLSLQEPGVRVSGLLAYEEDNTLHRIPGKYREILKGVNENLVILGENTAGGQISFRSDTGSLWIRAKLKAVPELCHMAPIGQGGFDCYVGRNRQELLCLGVTMFDLTEEEYQCEVISREAMEDLRLGRPAKGDPEEAPFYEFLIHLPLYCSVESIELGIDRGASIKPPSPYEREGSLVLYGTSITQGACATRPGLCYANLLARRLNLETYNFGFSGNGLGEPQMADLLTEIENPLLYVLDYEANAGDQKRHAGCLEETLEPLIRRLKEAHRDIPVVVVSKFPFVFETLSPRKRETCERLRRFQRETAERLNEELGGVWFIDGKELFPEGVDGLTVDTVHPTDLGFACMTEKLLRELEKIL